ncbi:DNA polymerase III subunit delta [Desulfosoma caldarium]|uniref:DNA polymerase III subunit delta n=1 Tax=Desulfosoma caldarium TaxID=610254 RepID=A0A3N1UQW2_9BACT|nr:DNA polymerase III subunit delta [Desulfosoma caldarium]ROQ91090.1 DNA polymerase III delta subunit [Desulfosoma caldarium]
MDSRLFFKHLGEIPPKTIYLFRGDEAALMDKAWEALLKAVRGLEGPSVQGESLDAKDTTVHEVVNRARTVPMFTSRRVLRVRHVDLWPKEQRDVLERYAANPNPRTHVVLTLGLKKSWKGLEKAVEAHGAIVDFQPLQERQLPAWAREKAAAWGKTLTPSAASLLVEAVGTDLHALEKEIEKLCLYVGDASQITADDVEVASSSIRSEHVFKLMDHVAEGRSAAAFAVLRHVLQRGDAPLGLLALLARHVRLLWQVKDGLARGETVSSLAKKLKLPPFAVEKTARYAHHFSEEALLQLHATLMATDLSLKTTALDPERALELILYRMGVFGAQKKAATPLGPPS